MVIEPEVCGDLVVKSGSCGDAWYACIWCMYDGMSLIGRGKWDERSQTGQSCFV